MREGWLALILCGLLLSACSELDVGDSPKPEPGREELVEFEEQDIDWVACDPVLFEEEEAEVVEAVEALGDRLECATLKTPLDWENPARDAVDLGISRVRAGDETKRKGAIFMNPGGPGGDGLLFGALFGLIFANGGAEAGFPAAAPDLMAQVSESYDIIGFSPRGVGSSVQLSCEITQELSFPEFYTNRSEENVQALLEQGRFLADICKDNALAEFITTEQTVQDMDLVRRLLGDEKLNYLGFSYGTWLGAWYAKRFPEQAGNIVLDANTEFSSDFQTLATAQAVGSQRGFEDVAAAYIARNNAQYELGDTPEAVYDVYESLDENLKAGISSSEANIQSLLFASENVPEVALNLMAAKGISAILDGLESPLSPSTLEAFIGEVSTYPYSDNETLNAEVVASASTVANGYLNYLILTGAIDLPTAPDPAEPEDPTDPDPSDPNPGNELSPLLAVNIAIQCNDSAWNKDPDFYVQLGNEQNEANPLIGGNLTFQPCAFWGENVTTMPDVPEDLPELLLVQSGYDPATPAEGAIRAFESLPNASFVYVENELSHTVFPYNTECVDAKVAQFLLDGTLPDATLSNCDALPLPGETEMFAPGTAPSLDGAATAQGLSVQAAQSAGDNELYDTAHKMLREDAAAFFGQ